MQEVKVIYKDIKNMILKVKPSLEVTLSVPKNVSAKEIDYVLQKRQRWIKDKLAILKEYQPQKRELVSGEDIYFLGKRYRLRVISSQEDDVVCVGEFLELRVKESKDFAYKQKVLKAWYKAKAERYFREILDRYIALIGFGEVRALKIKEMKTRWGSCNSKKAYINLNLKLMEKDKRAIEYVVLHELAHFKHYYHDKNFYAFIELYMPDWRERKKRLLQNDKGLVC